MSSSQVPVLPFDSDIGYPQKQRVSINNVAYTAFYRWNPSDNGFVVLTIERDTDSAVMLNSRIAELTPLAVRDPTTKIALFTVYPYSITSTKCEVWVING